MCWNLTALDSWSKVLDSASNLPVQFTIRILVADWETEMGDLEQPSTLEKVIPVFCLAAVTFRWAENYSS